VLIVAGLQVPVNPSMEVAGNAGAAMFRQSGPMAAKVDGIWLSVVISSVAVAAHCPAAGVKV
jgi:hypothetical protein